MESTFDRDIEFPIYEEMVDQYIRTGYYDETLLGNPITDYLIGVFRNPNIQLRVLSNYVFATIFKDHLLRFVDTVLNRVRFDFARKQAEIKSVEEAMHWNPDHNIDGQQALLAQLGENYDRFGLHSEFYRKEFEKAEKSRQEIWESLNRDYNIALNEHLRQEQRDEIAKNGDMTVKKIEDHAEKAEEFVGNNGITNDEFGQIWGMAGGMFMPREMSRLLRVVRLQKEYPTLTKLANMMGHTIDDDGMETIDVALGNKQELGHSSKSDIQGITIGREVDSMLPTDKALMADEKLEDLFMYKYVTGNLQNFRYKSESLRPLNSLLKQKAKPRGPMVACIDTSGSMIGKPTDIARSLLMKLVSIAERQKRELYVIAFSVSTRPFDARRERGKLLDFFRSDTSGDTDATKMLGQLFELLERNERYMSADVVLLSDFYIPMVKQELQDKIMSHKKRGTKFYGLQIGKNMGNAWEKYFRQLRI